MQRKLTAVVAGMLLLSLFFYYIVWPSIDDGRAVKEFCESIDTGISADSVAARAKDKGFLISRKKDLTTVLIYQKSTEDRFLCLVNLRGDKVTSAIHAVQF